MPVSRRSSASARASIVARWVSLEVEPPPARPASEAISSLKITDAVAAEVLGRVQRAVGGRQQRLGGGTVRGEGRQPEAHRQGHRGVAERFLDRGAQLLGHQVAVALLGLGQEHGELLAAGAGHGVHPAVRAVEQLSHPHEGGVAGRVAEAVVHALEVVEIADHHREHAVVAARPFDLHREGLLEAATVLQPGERIAAGGVGQPVHQLRQAVSQGLDDHRHQAERADGLGKPRAHQFRVGREGEDQPVGDRDPGDLDRCRAQGEEVRRVERDPDVEHLDVAGRRPEPLAAEEDAG